MKNHVTTIAVIASKQTRLPVVPAAIPRTRSLGLLTLGPIILNILGCHTLIVNGEGRFTVPIVVVVTALAPCLRRIKRETFDGLGPRIRA